MHDECMSRSESHERAASGPPLFFFFLFFFFCIGWGGTPEGAPPASHFFLMRGEDQQSGYEWSKVSLASTGKLVVRTGIKEVAGQTCALLDYGWLRFCCE